MKLIKPFIFSILALSCTQNTNTNSSRIVTETVVNRLDSTLSSFVELNRVAGVSALIYEKDEEVYFGAYGFADRLDGTKMQRNTIVQIYSMTKPITGVALMQLYERGLFSLDDPISNYLPEFKNVTVYEGTTQDGKPILSPPKRPITIRDLTRHTAGFANDRNAPYTGKLLAEADLFNFNNSLEVVIHKLSQIPLEFHPGEEWYYGPSVDVQARLVEVFTGMPFERYIRRNILAPLGMNETSYFVGEDKRHRMSSAYSKNEMGELVQIPDQRAHDLNINLYPLRQGGSGLTSTLDDYMTFARMLVNKGTLNGVQILKPETVELMATNQLSDEVTERRWLPSKGQVGFGIDFAVRTAPPQSAEENNGVVGEFFWDGAASTLFWVDPVNELTAVFFVQVFPFDGTLHKDFRDAVYGKYQPSNDAN